MANKPNTADQKLIEAAAHAGMSVEEFTAMVYGAVMESEDPSVRQVAQVASNRIVQGMTAEDKLVVKEATEAQTEAENFAEYEPMLDSVGKMLLAKGDRGIGEVIIRNRYDAKGNMSIWLHKAGPMPKAQLSPPTQPRKPVYWHNGNSWGELKDFLKQWGIIVGAGSTAATYLRRELQNKKPGACRIPDDARIEHPSIPNSQVGVGVSLIEYYEWWLNRTKAIENTLLLKPDGSALPHEEWQEMPDAELGDDEEPSDDELDEIDQESE